MNAKISVICYKSKTLSNGEHPIMIRISKVNCSKKIGLNLNKITCISYLFGKFCLFPFIIKKYLYLQKNKEHPLELRGAHIN